MQLPTAFIEKYRRLLGEEAPAFLASFDQPSWAGFRVNPLKEGQPTASLQTATGQVPYVPTGWYGKVNGRSLDHVTGWVYSQEPSAMYVGEVVDPQPGERVLDLCAAPGGKSTHLLAKMADTGLLVANEIFRKRAVVLAENLERWGGQHVVVANESPDQLAPHFPQFFDRILVDAPCSGEGMFRKEPAGMEYWTPDYPAECARRQKKILTSALTMLKPGGTLVYSTCTFAPEEDEQVAAWLLQTYPDLTMIPIKKYPGMDDGRPEWADGNPDLKQAVRLFPHHLKGEGHFIAKFKRAGAPTVTVKSKRHKKQRQRANHLTPTKVEQAWWTTFQHRALPNYQVGQLVCFGDQLYDLPAGMPPIDDLRLVRPGLHLGTLKKGRFEPGLALALATRPTTCPVTLPLDLDQWRAYVHGETLAGPRDRENGWYLLVCRGHAAGWGKLVNGTIKNFFPKGLRF